MPKPTKTNACKAKNPATCPWHGAELRMNTALANLARLAPETGEFKAAFNVAYEARKEMDRQEALKGGSWIESDLPVDSVPETLTLSVDKEKELQKRDTAVRDRYWEFREANLDLTHDEALKVLDEFDNINFGNGWYKEASVASQDAYWDVQAKNPYKYTKMYVEQARQARAKDLYDAWEGDSRFVFNPADESEQVRTLRKKIAERQTEVFNLRSSKRKIGSNPEAKFFNDKINGNIRALGAHIARETRELNALL